MSQPKLYALKWLGNDYKTMESKMAITDLIYPLIYVNEEEQGRAPKLLFKGRV